MSVSRAMAQFFLKIAHLSFSMGPTSLLKKVFSYGLRPRLWLLVTANEIAQFFGTSLESLAKGTGEKGKLKKHAHL